MPTRQRAVLVTQQKPGNPQGSIEVREVGIPSPAEGEVLLKVICRPVHPVDVLILHVPTPLFSPASLPAVPGMEGVACVAQNGLKSSKFKEGQRVVPMFDTSSGEGSWQQYVCVKESVLIAVPDAVTDESASQFYLNPCTVAGMLDTLKVPKGEWLLQSAAGSVLGRQVIQLARHYEFKTINLVRRREQVKEVIEAGGDEVLCNEDDIAAEVQRITGGRGAYGAIDAVAGDLTARMVAAVRPKGTLLIYGVMDGMTATLNLMEMLFKSKVVAGFSVTAWLEGLGDKKHAKLGELMDLFDQKVLEPFSGKSYDLAQVVDALQEAQRPARGGKVLLIG